MNLVLVIFVVALIASAQSQVFTKITSLDAATYIVNHLQLIEGTESDYRMTLSQAHMSCFFGRDLILQMVMDLIEQLGSGTVSYARSFCNKQETSEATCQSTDFLYNVTTLPYHLTLKNLPTNWKTFLTPSVIANIIDNCSIVRAIVEFFGYSRIQGAYVCFSWTK